MAKRIIQIGLLLGLGSVFIVVTRAQVVQVTSSPKNSIDSISLTTDPTREHTSSDVVWPVFNDSTNTAGVFADTGADTCGDVTVVPVTVGPPGFPSVPVTITGDNTTASGLDCAILGPSPVWWEAFFIDKVSKVYLDLCGTTPEQVPSYNFLMSGCTNRVNCTFDLIKFSTESGTGAPVCSDGNSWMTFVLGSGTYYYPVFSDENVLVNGRGPYQIHISAEEFVFPDGPPDIITGHIANLDGLLQIGREGAIGSGTVGLGLSTTSCNQGGTIAKWFELPNTNHPVMTGNLYRYHDVDGSDRLEQIGQAWIKHGFGSSNDNECGFGCICVPENNCNFSTVGPGCSDSYAAIQFDPCGFHSTGLMASRSVIHPYTGVMPGGDEMGPGGGCGLNWPSANHFGHNHEYPDGAFFASGISHRLQVKDVDLIPGLNPDVRYIVEGMYIVPDEYIESNGTQNNNVTSREVGVTGPDIDGVFTFNNLEASNDQSPAIDAWVGVSQSMIEPAPMGDGRAFLAYEVTDLGGGQWHYEYGLYNMNMDAAMRSITFPVPNGVTISNVDFHAPLNHAPVTNAENYPNTPWDFENGDGFLRWSVASFVVDPLANAVRWGTMYNFRFDANTPPQSQYAEVVLFKTGQSVNTPTLVPQAVGQSDCNNNSINDLCDLDCNASGCNVKGCGGSTDCDGTGVPDECEIDCNGNGIADSCDIAGDPALDCTGNGIPDVCEADCNGDGIADVCQLLEQTLVDANADGIPDICDITAPGAEPVPIKKSRYLTIVPGNAGNLIGIRVTLIQLDGFGSFDSQVRWVGPPAEFQEGATPTPTFFAAGLHCTPHYMDWGGFEILHLYGDSVVPGSIYDIQMIVEGLDIGVESAYSSPLTVHTGKWGDIITPFEGEGSTQPSISDVLSLVDKWLGTIDPIKASAQLRPNVPDPSQNVGIAEVLLGVDAWLGVLYPFDGPSVCP